MKNIKNKLFFAINVFIMFLIVGMIIASDIKVDASSEIQVTFTETELGKETFSYTVDEVVVESEGGSLPKGTKIKLNAEPNDNARFYFWVYYLDGKPMKLSDSPSVSVVVNQNYQFTAVYASENQVVATFYNLANKFVDYQIVEIGNDATYVEIATKKGSNVKGWDKSLKNLTEDTEFKPLYTTTAWTIFRDYSSSFFKGLGLTLAFSVISVFLALFLGAILCLAKISTFKPLSFIATAYIEIIRGVPLLLQLLLIYAMMPRISLGSFLNTEILAAILALFLNSGAYVAEIFRSGIQAVDKGQMEAGRALGLSKWQTMRKIIIPQAIKNVLPSIGNELIMVIKETSLASTVDAGIGELMSVKKQITAATFSNIPPFIVIAIMYFVVTFTLSKVVRYIERRLEARD